MVLEPIEETSKHTILYNYKNKRAMYKKLDTRTVALLDNNSTMDLLYKPYLVEDIQKVNKPLTIQSNVRYIYVNKKAHILGYNKKVWFNRRDITIIIELTNLTKKHQVTYNINDQIFILHREEADLTNMEFLMHESGLNYQ